MPSINSNNNETIEKGLSEHSEKKGTTTMLKNPIHNFQ